MITIRHDKGKILEKHLTPEGFLKVKAIFTRTGVFKYLNNDGTIRNELRHPDDVLKQDSLETMKLIPMTLLHPKERVVDSSNAKILSVGYTGENIEHDGRLVKGTIVVTDKKAIKSINNGVQELSLGYKVELVEDKGEYEGVRHDYRQTNMKYNHLAIVPQGRAGEAKIILDSVDAVQQINEDNNSDPKPQQKEKRMLKTISLDGIEYEASPEVINAFNKSKAEAEDLKGKLDTVTSEKDAVQAKFDAAESKLKELEKVDNSDEINKAVKARVNMLSHARTHLDEKECEDLEAKSDADIKLMIIKKYNPNFDSEKKSEAYIDAMFDIALENDPKKENKQDSSIKTQRKKVFGQNKNDKDDDRVDAVEARKRYQKSLTEQWKPAEAKA